jgi:hypothetical protein
VTFIELPLVLLVLVVEFLVHVERRPGKQPRQDLRVRRKTEEDGTRSRDLSAGLRADPDDAYLTAAGALVDPLGDFHEDRATVAENPHPRLIRAQLV